MLKPLDTVVDWLNKYQTILIIIHQMPDGDAIASSLALALALKAKQKTVTVISADQIPRPFQYLPSLETVSHDFFQGDWEVMVVLDCGDLKRTGFPERVKEFGIRKKRLINIDHHPKNDLHKIATINLVDTAASSTGEIVSRVIDQLGVVLNKDIATCLLTALYTDTGGFKHANTSKTTLELAARLMASGARLKTITKHISIAKSVTSLKLWGLVLSRIIRNQRLGIIASIVTQDDLKACNASMEDLAGVVNLIGTVPGTKAAILLTEMEPGVIKASLRTESDIVDVSRIAFLFGGGGHKKASGFTIAGKIFKDRAKWRILLT